MLFLWTHQPAHPTPIHVRPCLLPNTGKWKIDFGCVAEYLRYATVNNVQTDSRTYKSTKRIRAEEKARNDEKLSARSIFSSLNRQCCSKHNCVQFFSV